MSKNDLNEQQLQEKAIIDGAVDGFMAKAGIEQAPAMSEEKQRVVSAMNHVAYGLMNAPTFKKP